MPPSRDAHPAVPTYELKSDVGVERLCQNEWLLTNGFSGFAMGTPSGVPARRYHGLLVSDTQTSPQRRVYVNTLSEELVISRKSEGVSDGSPENVVVPLSTFRFRAADGNDVLHPEGWKQLGSFQKSAGCRWEFNTHGVTVVKQLVLRRDVRACVVNYDISPARGVKVELRVRPLVSLRNYHWTQRRDEGARQFAVTPSAHGCEVRRVGENVRAFLSCEGGVFEHDEQWWHNFVYAVDRARGQECAEDLFGPGLFVFRALPRKTRFEATLQCALEAGTPIVPIPELEKREALRRKTLASAVTKGASKASVAPLTRLASAADDFVFSRDAKSGDRFVSIIAGYPWFTDWGRDSMIALPGLLLLPGRHDEAFRVLKRFAAARRGGIIPNRFEDELGEPLYNTVDASLWFIVACWRYLQATKDAKGFHADLMPACLDVVDSYRKGTDQGIAMDPRDFLVSAGSPMTQLTWMDAVRDGVVFTPRHGKAVEINALWCSGLAMLADSAPADPIRSADLRAMADAAGSSFRARFWNEARGCCFDTITAAENGWNGVAEVRPNQIFAVSLPFSPLTPAQQQSVVSCVINRLYTPMGLRTLEPGDPSYKPRFRGNLFDLDSAYHNGTVWPWLLGALAEAVMRVDGFSKGSRNQARELLEPIVGFMESWCIGQLPEVFDAEGTADDPQQPGGCPAQAWSVAEVLRGWVMAERGAAD